MSAFDQDAVTDQHREEGKHLAALVTAKDTPNYRRVLRDNEAFLARWICDHEKKTGLERSASNGATSGSHHNTSTSVRELEWNELLTTHWQSDVGGYLITEMHPKTFNAFRNGHDFGYFSSIEEAKTACQSDFQKRDNECLEPTNCEPKASAAIYQDAHRASVRSTIATSMNREEALQVGYARLVAAATKALKFVEAIETGGRDEGDNYAASDVAKGLRSALSPKEDG